MMKDIELKIELRLEKDKKSIIEKNIEKHI
jgi:hypothetical protein